MRQIEKIYRLLLPENKQELILISFLFVFYLSFALVLVFDSNLLDYNTVRADLYFSFDSLIFYHMNGEDLVSHPFIRLITRPISYTAGIISSLFGYAKLKTILILLFTVYCVSMSCILVFRFLKNIIELNIMPSLLLSLMYASFFTCQILSFTLESFTISLLFLMVMSYFYALSIKNDSKNSFMTDAFFSLMAGGITTTNFAKGVVCVFFSKGDYKPKIIRILLLSVSFVVICFVVYGIFIQNPDSQYNNVFGKYSTYSSASITIGEYVMRIIDTFLIMPILSLDLLVIDHYVDSLNRIIHTFEASLSTSWWRYLFAIVFYGLGYPN